MSALRRTLSVTREANAPRLVETLADEGRSIEREVGVQNTIPGCCSTRVQSDAEDVSDEGRREAHELVCGVPKAVGLA
jgi:hypothetical protein